MREIEDSAPLAIRRAHGFWARTRGLLGVRHLDASEALWLTPCRAVHTIGMRIAIDVVFLDAHGKVLAVVANLLPCRLAFCWRAASVLELAAGSANQPGATARIERAVAHLL